MEYDENENAAIGAGAYQSPMYNYGSSIIMLTNPEDELNRMEATFRSVLIDPETGKPKPVGDPLMNEFGIRSVMGLAQSIINKHSIMGNFDKDIPLLMDFLADTLARDLMVSRIKYGIKNNSARDKIYFSALTSAYISLKRGYKEGDRRFWKGSTQEITTRIDGKQQQGSRFGRFFGWGG